MNETDKPDFSRRDFIKAAVLTSVAAPLVTAGLKEQMQPLPAKRPSPSACSTTNRCSLTAESASAFPGLAVRYERILGSASGQKTRNCPFRVGPSPTGLMGPSS